MCEEVVSPKIKLLWKSSIIFEKRNPQSKKKIQIRLFIFPKRFPHPNKYSWGISYQYLPGWPEPTEEEMIRLCLCHTILMLSWKLDESQKKELPQFLLITVDISSQGLISAPNLIVPHRHRPYHSLTLKENYFRDFVTESLRAIYQVLKLY